MPPSVSVALATYNGGRFLAEQLQSIAVQSVAPAELVISDDGSADDTLEITERFAASAPFPVRIHRNPRNLGFIGNFRTAASLCKGDLIAFCDQDDWWHRNRLETCLAAFDDPEVLLVYHNAMMVDEARQPIGMLYNAEIEERALATRPIAPWKWSNGLLQVFRAELRRFDDLWDQSRSHTRDSILAHDRWYFFLAQALGRVEFVDEVLVEYRQHGGNTYGIGPDVPSKKRTLFDRLQHEGSKDLRYAKAAEARSSIMRQIAEREAGKRARLIEIADRYQLLGERSARRHRTYSSSSFADRLSSLFSSWNAGDYADWPWGFDPRSVVRDMWTGVVLGRV